MGPFISVLGVKFKVGSVRESLSCQLINQVDQLLFSFKVLVDEIFEGVNRVVEESASGIKVINEILVEKLGNLWDCDIVTLNCEDIQFICWSCHQVALEMGILNWDVVHQRVKIILENTNQIACGLIIVFSKFPSKEFLVKDSDFQIAVSDIYRGGKHSSGLSEVRMILLGDTHGVVNEHQTLAMSWNILAFSKTNVLEWSADCSWGMSSISQLEVNGLKQFIRVFSNFTDGGGFQILCNLQELGKFKKGRHHKCKENLMNVRESQIWPIKVIMLIVSFINVMRVMGIKLKKVTIKVNWYMSAYQKSTNFELKLGLVKLKAN